MSDQSLIVDQPQSSGAISLNTLGTLMSAAIDKGMAPEALEKLVDLQERLMKQQAVSAFNQAMQAFQSRCPVIPHNRTVDTGKFSYTFADLSQIRRTIQPLLDECQLTYSFETVFQDGRIKVTCSVKHVLGHSESSSFEAAICGTDKMSSIQKSASTVTYGQRYALRGALGLMTTDEDTDGRTGEEPHQNPQADADAPRARTRRERQGAPEDPVLDERKAKLTAVFKLWLNDAEHPDRKAASKEERQSMFRNWARVVSGSETLDPTKPDQWTAADDEAFKACDLYFAEPA